ncbi:MAG: hypothetical protein ACH0QD_06555 [Tepidibacillus sp.]|uniref:hypothetical protein n=1 Tax=Tepidibacillus sp. HK-1 TaxID=1883407 RepID=UPI0015EBF38D|nr:hypothetical protein [Tepidibacillus sp. HK-1]
MVGYFCGFLFLDMQKKEGEKSMLKKSLVWLSGCGIANDVSSKQPEVQTPANSVSSITNYPSTITDDSGTQTETLFALGIVLGAHRIIDGLESIVNALYPDLLELVMI